MNREWLGDLRIQTKTGKFLAFLGVKTLKKRQSSFPTSVAVKLKLLGLPKLGRRLICVREQILTAAHRYPEDISGDMTLLQSSDFDSLLVVGAFAISGSRLVGRRIVFSILLASIIMILMLDNIRTKI